MSEDFSTAPHLLEWVPRLRVEPERFVIWWLSTQEAECVAVSRLPQHLQDAVEARRGRAGRGRLWNTGKGQPDSISGPWPHTALANSLAESGGLVLTVEDVKYLEDQPGVLTTMDVKRWPRLPAQE